MSFQSLTTQLTDIQAILSGNITYLSASQSININQPNFYFGKEYYYTQNPYPFIVWAPIRIETLHQQYSLGMVPRPLYLDKVSLKVYVVGESFDKVDFLREQIIVATRNSPSWWKDNVIGFTSILNPKSSQMGSDFWTEEMDLTIYSPVWDLMPLTASIQQFQFITGSNPPSGSLTVPSGSN